MGRRKQGYIVGGSQQRICPSCEEAFTTTRDRSEGALYDFCLECRHAFCLSTNADAEELMAMFDCNMIDREGRAQMLGFPRQTPQRVVDATPAKPKVDPEKVAMGIRAMTDYKLGPFTAFEKPITYVCHKNGVFEYRDSELAVVCVQPKEILGMTSEGKPGVTFKLPKVPFLFLQQTVSFFRGVEARMKSSSEALVQIWWDRQEQRHLMHVPEQEVSGGGVHHRSVFDQDSSGRYFHVADIHSHGTNMSAFWSGVDDADERKVTTERLFGVIGKVTAPIPQWKWRMRTRDGFIDLAVEDIFELPSEPLMFSVTPADIFRSLASEQTYKDGKVSLWCPVDPFADVEIPTTWYDQVKPRYVQQSHYTGSHHGPTFGSFPSQRNMVIKGFVFINGIEYESLEDGTIKPTGHKLLTRTELEAIRNGQQ